MPDLSPPQARLLAFLARHPVWHSVVELRLVRTLQDGEADALEALVALSMVQQMRGSLAPLAWVRITPVGKIIAEEISRANAVR